MSNWNSIRIKASQTRREILEKQGLDWNQSIDPQSLIELAADHFDLIVSPASKDSNNLQGSVAVLSNGMIFFDHTLKDGYKQYCIAHELGHHILHRNTDNCSDTDIQEYSPDDDSPSSIGQLEGYGARERREREANLFAIEFLLPCEVVRREFIGSEDSVARICETTKLSESMVYSQFATAVLTPTVSVAEPDEKKSRPEFELDESQSAAARADSGPLLITAGPGTGKTHTLVKRVLFLLNEKRIAPERILALTFSRKATEEMRERISEKAPEEAQKITVMTFHGYALELLRKYFSEAGLDADSGLIEKVDAILHLEDHFDDLGLDRLKDFSDPSEILSKILENISRAKDELISPETFMSMALQERETASGDKEKEKADKAIECAKVYEFYQDFLEREKVLDYGELIYRAVKLLQGNESVRKAVRSKYDAILVDEFQDINRACGVMIKEISGDGKGLWAVGDLRQSIYRWRGASPNNINRFAEDYPGAKTLLLNKNYRSGTSIVDAFSEFARGMSAVNEPDFPGWEAVTETPAGITHHFAADVVTEVGHVALECKSLQSKGTPFSRQAVIARTNTQLNRFADGLVEQGVPVLFLGNLFERPEIRDLLSMLDLVSSKAGLGLHRFGRFPEYSIPNEDIALILESIAVKNSGFRNYILTDEFPEGMSDHGRTSFARLRDDLRKLPVHSSAVDVLSSFLFDDGRFIKRILNNENDVLNSQRLLAIYQLFTLASLTKSRFQDRGDDQVAEFLEHVLKLLRFRESKGFSQMPASAQAIDAVRLMTVHGSKGLEFDAVFMPFLSESYFPFRRLGGGVPAPAILDEDGLDSHYEEEECLFFVAMSRARRRLALSRAEKYSEAQIAKPSRFLEKIRKHIPEPVKLQNLAAERMDGDMESERNHEFHQIKTYMSCPRRYYYKEVLKLNPEQRAEGAHRLLEDVVRTTRKDIQRILKAGHSVDEKSALEILASFWQLGELDSRLKLKFYRQRAEDMLKVLVRRIGDTKEEIRPEKLKYEFENGTIYIVPDHLEVLNDRVRIRIFEIGKGKTLDGGKFETADEAEVLLLLAAGRAYHGAPVEIEKTYLGSGIDRTVQVTNRARAGKIEKFEKALKGIRSRRFQPNRGPECVKCHYYFICGQ